MNHDHAGTFALNGIIISQIALQSGVSLLVFHILTDDSGTLKGMEMRRKPVKSPAENKFFNNMILTFRSFMQGTG